jgi:2-keto-3-deoxy-L-rhamnonate aldolase RhmA
LTESIPLLNQVTLVVCMIETLEGLENVEEIAAVDGVHVGTNDLLVNMGKPGRYDDPEIFAAQDRVIAVAKANGKYAGCGGNRDVARQAQVIRRGAQFITTQTDVAFLAAAASRWTTDLRALLAERG